MICPSCGTYLPDGTTSCPVCHEAIGAAAALRGMWCPSCGAGATWADEVCPHCGYPIAFEREARLEHVPEVDGFEATDALDNSPTADETSDTRTIARIESAIPCENDPENKVVSAEMMPRGNRFMLAAAASIALVCGIVLLLAHPWDPDAYATRATKEADTTLAGFPGTVEELSGQDRGSHDASEQLSGDERAFVQLNDAYTKLKLYATRADECSQAFAEVAFGSDDSARSSERHAVEVLAIDVDNLIDAINDVDVSSGTYAEAQSNLLTLGKWLSSRVQLYAAAWLEVAKSPDPAAERARIEATLNPPTQTDGERVYMLLFDENYDAYKPIAKEGM